MMSNEIVYRPRDSWLQSGAALLCVPAPWSGPGCFGGPSRSTNTAHLQRALHHHRADDFPAYLNIVLVGHIRCRWCSRSKPHLRRPIGARDDIGCRSSHPCIRSRHPIKGPWSRGNGRCACMASILTAASTIRFLRSHDHKMRELTDLEKRLTAAEREPRPRIASERRRDSDDRRPVRCHAEGAAGKRHHGHKFMPGKFVFRAAGWSPTTG